jgi:hypothetical protein
MAKSGKQQGTQDSPRIALTQIEELMASSPQRGDALRAAGLDGLIAVKRVKLIQTRRERARVAVRHGETSDRVARLDRQLALEHRFLVNMRAEADRVAAPMPAQDENAWHVHGYLRSQDGVSRAKYGVALFADADGRKSLAETSTDKRGYFLIRLEMKAAAKDEIKAASAQAELPNDAEKEKAERAAAADRMAQRFVRALGAPAFLGITAPGASSVIDARPLYPLPGGIAYRDLAVADPKDDGSACQLKTRLLGNSSTRELHDLENEKPACQIAEIQPDHRFYFQNEDQARKLGYDFCGYCFGKKRSKR